MTDLTGKTIYPYGQTGPRVKVLSVSDSGEYYNCINLESGQPFQALKEVYDRIFIPKINREVKPLHYKGENPNYKCRT